jgi:formiminoglutamase
MDKIIPFSINDLAKVTNHRSGEIKFGEKMILIPKGVAIIDFLATCEAKFVLFSTIDFVKEVRFWYLES